MCRRIGLACRMEAWTNCARAVAAAAALRCPRAAPALVETERADASVALAAAAARRPLRSW